ncbi:uncharacterized protein EI97DRAFT_202782 [Westerdykella ornata]|uniref:F-box domain-containing protein n=1 Tax=Westerdykella ornata TaxID=318751 RepID=A0A6A6J8I0_WESOR|nr:uncharacterized protein EI97DRAFT_202782 [Westerdykella ornata]KAF2272675.1 hypothetical protein EI97DRAFT_202782 [Westerdykella ornata]
MEAVMAFPSYLSRYIDLGFDSDDVSALIDDIDASDLEYSESESESESTLLRLPAEVLLNVLEFVPIGHILGLRLVCKAFRDWIDTRVLYSYLPRTQLYFYAGGAGVEIKSEKRAEVRWITASFSHLETPACSINTQPRAKWSSPTAIFRLDPNGHWMKSVLDIGDPKTIEELLDRLPEVARDRTPGSFAKPGWFIKVDEAVFDLDLGRKKKPSPEMHVDMERNFVRVRWKTMLKNLAKSEARLIQMLQEQPVCGFTFSHFEDCLRTVRRQRVGYLLDHNDKEDRMMAWQLKFLPPLFGIPDHNKGRPDPQFDLLPSEEYAIKHLLRFRKEAAMSEKERNRLLQLAEDRRTMMKEMQELQRLFVEWKLDMYDADLEPTSYYLVSLQREDVNKFVELPSSPFAWSDETIAKEERRIARWRSQKGIRMKMMDLLRESHEALNVPEDAFDDPFSDG